MRQITIHTTDKDFPKFLELAKTLPFVKKIETSEGTGDILENIKNGLEEVKLFEEGKLKTTPAKEFLDEL
jgi:hypothetical protein